MYKCVWITVLVAGYDCGSVFNPITNTFVCGIKVLTSYLSCVSLC